MSQNRELHKRLRSAQARFYPADLHVHTPASADVRLGSRFQALPDEFRASLSKISESLTDDPKAYETSVLEVLPPQQFFELLVARRHELTSTEEDEDGGQWGLAALTDHNVCEYSCRVADVAWSRLSECKLILLPGIELSVTYPVPPGDSSASAHILCLFRPGVSESDIRVAISRAANENWTFGASLPLASLPEFVHRIRRDEDYPAICIAAHVGSSEGVQKETRNAILTRLDAAISRVAGELESSEAPDVEVLRGQLERLDLKRTDRDDIALEILNLLGQCGFDALQVRGKEDEVHYRRLHRFRQELGRAVPIVCSDAHRVQDAFGTDAGVPYLKLPDLRAGISPSEIHEAVSKALRLGETRFGYLSPEGPGYWIGGLEISPDASDAAEFWPSEGAPTNAEESFILPLSPNLNCLIGGRGSGKSAALEALAFLNLPTDFDKPEQRREDYYLRAQATLKGSTVKLCWQFVGSDAAQALPKKAVFASRYFDPRGGHSEVKYQTADDIELLAEQVPEHPVQYYRLGEIEKQTGSARLRTLFDEICGSDIKKLDESISGQIAALSKQRAEITKVSKAIAELTKDGSPLREYARRKRLFAEVDAADIRQACQEVDEVSAAETASRNAKLEWSGIEESAGLDELSRRVGNFFDLWEAESQADGDGDPKPFHENLARLCRPESMQSGEDAVPRTRVSNSISALGVALSGVTNDLSNVVEEVTNHAMDARNALQARGLPAGSADREAKKAALQESENALAQYRELIRQWDVLNDARTSLVSDLLCESERRSLIRQRTARQITDRLARDLDPNVLVIEADAQPGAEKIEFHGWLDSHFAFQDVKYRQQRIQALLARGLEPSNLRRLLLCNGTVDPELLQVKADSAESGAIGKNIADSLRDRCMGRVRLEAEAKETETDHGDWLALPDEIKKGLWAFPSADKGQSELRVDDVLRLDEITADDIPVIRLNDRPTDPRSKARPVDELSPGQRCSAILPILLLTNDCPLLIDQPEDNMDNRLIRQVIVNILSSMKLKRQVILATHNPNLPVLGDAEQAVILQGVGEQSCEVRAMGDLDSSDVVHNLMDVMEGGREAFQYRQTMYQLHWPGPVAQEP